MANVFCNIITLVLMLRTDRPREATSASALWTPASAPLEGHRERKNKENARESHMNTSAWHK
eukprot:1267027-Amphidinium_carterae.1